MAERKDPAAPYHQLDTPEGGAAPRDAGGESPPQRAPDVTPDHARRGSHGKIEQERQDHENEGANAPRGGTVE